MTDKVRRKYAFTEGQTRIHATWLPVPREEVSVGVPSEGTGAISWKRGLRSFWATELLKVDTLYWFGNKSGYFLKISNAWVYLTGTIQRIQRTTKGQWRPAEGHRLMCPEAPTTVNFRVNPRNTTLYRGNADPIYGRAPGRRGWGRRETVTKGVCKRKTTQIGAERMFSS